MHNAFECGKDFVRIDIALLTCERFQALSRTAQLVLIDFIGRYRSVKNARISFPFKSRLNKGIRRTAFVTAVNELVAAGFLDKDHRNGARATYAESKFWRSGVVENRAGIQTGAATEGEAEACRKPLRSEAEGELKPCRKSTRSVPEIDTERAGNRHGACRKSTRSVPENKPVPCRKTDRCRAGNRHGACRKSARAYRSDSKIPPTPHG